MSDPSRPDLPENGYRFSQIMLILNEHCRGKPATILYQINHSASRKLSRSQSGLQSLSLTRHWLLSACSLYRLKQKLGTVRQIVDPALVVQSRGPQAAAKSPKSSMFITPSAPRGTRSSDGSSRSQEATKISRSGQSTKPSPFRSARAVSLSC